MDKDNTLVLWMLVFTNKCIKLSYTVEWPLCERNKLINEESSPTLFLSLPVCFLKLLDGPYSPAYLITSATRLYLL